ncbi:MAG: cystathionine beta-synthase [Isosphaera sp.]|nr:cystathionine beta-synthase [Isosphaera sp.]
MAWSLPGQSRLPGCRRRRGRENAGMQPSPSILDRVGNTPMVRLSRVAAGLPVPVLGKCEFLNPGGSVKDRIALAILDDAEAKGLLRPGATLVEATAGNTGVGLALVAAARGYRLVCVLPEKMSADKRAALAAVGAEVVVVPNAAPSSPENFQNVARRLAAEHGWFPTEQFAHPANPRVHEATTGPEVLAQCGGRVGAFVCGVGTGGTITGAGRFLKARCPGVRVVLADPVGSRLAHLVDPAHPDHDAAYQVEGIGGSVMPAACDPAVIDAAERVSDDESFETTRRLIREEGLLVGGSSGTAVAAALRVAAGGCAGPVVALLADSWDRYLSRPWLRAGGAVSG